MNNWRENSPTKTMTIVIFLPTNYLVLECFNVTFKDEKSKLNVKYRLKYHQNAIKSNRLIALISFLQLIEY